MARHGCPEELIFVLRKLYTDTTMQLKGFGKGFTTPSTVGVKQGDNLAPVLFIFFINAVAESIESRSGRRPTSMSPGCPAISATKQGRRSVTVTQR